MFFLVLCYKSIRSLFLWKHEACLFSHLLILSWELIPPAWWHPVHFFTEQKSALYAHDAVPEAVHIYGPVIQHREPHYTICLTAPLLCSIAWLSDRKKKGENDKDPAIEDQWTRHPHTLREAKHGSGSFILQLTVRQPVVNHTALKKESKQSGEVGEIMCVCACACVCVCACACVWVCDSAHHSDPVTES